MRNTMKPSDETMKLYTEIGRRIRNARVAKNLSQEGLAVGVGLTRTSITNIEKGRQKLLVHTLWAIARELSVDVSSLLPSVEEPFEEALKELPVEHQRVVKATLKAALEEKGELDA